MIDRIWSEFPTPHPLSEHVLMQAVLGLCLSTVTRGMLRTSTRLIRHLAPRNFRPIRLGSHFAPIVQRSTQQRYLVSMAVSSQGEAWKPSKPRGRQRVTDHKTGPKGEPMTPIPSATLIVLCPRSSKDAQGSTQYDTLMVQRSARDGSSFRSAVVFPGGALDLEDEAAIDAALGASSETSASQSKEGYMQALKLCALRETFEETGLLLLPSANAAKNGLAFCRAVGHQEAGISAEDWNTARNDVHHNAIDFVPFLRKVSAKLGLDNTVGKGESALPTLAPMTHHSNWITPRGVVRPAKRFDAHFFITVLDTADAFGSDKTLQLSADGSETLSLRLGTPQEIMDLGISDQISLFPPQFYILADLEAAFSASSQNGLQIQPLIFDPSDDTAPSSPEAEYRVTPVEEENRGLRLKEYSWERKDVKPVTAVEPRAYPKLGSMVDVRSLGTESEDSFVFPLVLPGDWQSSPSQKARARQGIHLPSGGADSLHAPAATPTAPIPASEQPKSAKEGVKALNRLYVSPRAPEHGGGMTVRGAVRKNLGNLRDFQIGIMLNAPDSERNSKL